MMQEFLVDRYIEMDFCISEYAIPIYTNLNMSNKIKLDSAMNGLRYKRPNEIKAIKLVDLKGKTMRELCREYI